jgi:hypothetical protein
VVAILRGDFREDAEDVAAALLAGGLRALEVSLTSADALAILARLVRYAEGRSAVVGAGIRRVGTSRGVRSTVRGLHAVGRHIDGRRHAASVAP